MKRDRVISFIDGFNLYHAVDALDNSAFKWLDLRKLSQEFINPVKEELTQVLYFSTIASHRNIERLNLQSLSFIWRKSLSLSERRHKQMGMKATMGLFKEALDLPLKTCVLCRFNPIKKRT